MEKAVGPRCLFGDRGFCLWICMGTLGFATGQIRVVLLGDTSVCFDGGNNPRQVYTGDISSLPPIAAEGDWKPVAQLGEKVGSEPKKLSSAAIVTASSPTRLVRNLLRGSSEGPDEPKLLRCYVLNI